jgi:hypothetical protein
VSWLREALHGVSWHHMSWYELAGIALLVLAGAIALTHRRATLFVQTLPVAAVGVAVLYRSQWALVIGAVLASVWLLDQALSWRPRDPVRVHRLRFPAHALMSALSLAVAVIVWLAVAAAHIAPAV